MLGRQIGAWTQKAKQESQRGATVVCLLPARTDTTWWHRDVMTAAKIWLVKGRLKFEHVDGRAATPAPFPSAIVVFTPDHDTPAFSTFDLAASSLTLF